jgi:hypothetical protein
MTEQTSGPQAPSQTLSSDSTQTSSEVLVDLLQRVRSLEDQSKIFLASLNENLHPRIEALEQAVESLAKRGETSVADFSSRSPAELASIVHELHDVVHAIAGTQFAHDGTKYLAHFHSWWKKIMGVPESAPAPVTLSQGGGSVTNESTPKGPLQPSPK